jgi:integrase
MAVKKLPNGRYVADFRDAQGNRYRPQFDTYKEADAALADNKVKIRRGEFLAPAKTPNFEKVASAWLVSRADRRAGVYDNYRHHVEGFWIPKLGNLRLDRIDVHLIESLRAELRQRLAISTLRSRMNTLSQIFKYAVREKHLVINPMLSVERLHERTKEIVEGVDTSDQREGTQKVKPEDVLNIGEIRRLIDAARPGIYRTLFTVAAATGARSGELFALSWDDIDFDDGKGGGRISITKSFSWAKGTEDAMRVHHYPPKTESGKREVPISHEVVLMLKTWKLQCPPGNLVFPASDGRPIRRSTVYLRGFLPALKAAGLRKVRLHSLRHSFASTLIAHGSPISQVSSLLGHKDSVVTLRVYTHWMEKTDTSASDKLAAALFGRQDGQLVDTNG